MALRNIGKTIHKQIMYGLTFIPPPPPSNGGMKLVAYSVPPLVAFLFRDEIFEGIRKCGNILIERFLEKWQILNIGKYIKFRVRKQPSIQFKESTQEEPTYISEVITPLENEYPKENKDGSFVV